MFAPQKPPVIETPEAFRTQIRPLAVAAGGFGRMSLLMMESSGRTK
jgi:hypothetical protein